MAEQHGKEGAVKVATNAVYHVTEWSIDFGVAADETTTFGDDWKTFIAGLGEWTGSFSGSYDYTDTNGQKAIQDLIVTAAPTATLATMRFYVNASNYYSGTIFFTGLSINLSVSGVASFTITFTGSGAPSYN